MNNVVHLDQKPLHLFNMNRVLSFQWYKLTMIFGLICFLFYQVSYGQLCNGSGNVVVFSNYDGSGNTAATRLNINVDVNIPNLKIGICSYERVTVNITGAFVGNVTAVRWAGYGATNNHCTSTAATIITGVPAGIITYVTNPPSPVSDPAGNPNIIGGYSCPMGNSGGSASMYQIVNYFLGAFGPGSSLRSSFSQYGCWAGTTKNLSAAASGNCCPSTPLPVELVSFHATCENNYVILNWTTVSEINNDYFTVEKSFDGINYEKVAEVDGNENSNSLINYEWIDHGSIYRDVYYRLIQTDHNGVSEYFDPISLINQCENNNQLTILNNPLQSILTISYMGYENYESLQVLVMDMKGNVLQTHSSVSMEGKNIFMYDIEGLRSGIYLVNVSSKNTYLQQKFVKL